MKRVLLRIHDIFTADYEFVFLVLAGILLVFGVVLIFPFPYPLSATFALPTFARFAELINEDLAGIILIALALGGVVALILEKPLGLMSLIYAAAFTFIGVVLTASTPNSTAWIYIVPAVAAVWTFLRWESPP